MAVLDQIRISGNVFDIQDTTARNGLNAKADTTAVTAAIDAATSGKADASAVAEEISAAVSGKADTSAVTEEINAATSGKADTSAVTAAIDAATSGKADTSAVTEAINAATSGKADSSAVTAEISAAVSGKQDTLVSGTNIKTINNTSILGSGDITIQAGNNVVELTQEEYDELDPPSADTFYIITDATPIDISNYYTKQQTSSSTQISDALSVKADTSAVNEAINAATSGKADTSAVTAAIDAATSGKADTSAVTEAINAATSGKADTTAVTAAIDAATSGKLDTSASTSFFDYAVYDSGTTEIKFYHNGSGGTVIATIDATAFIKDGMVDNVEISGGNLVITFNTDAGKQDISIPLTDIFDPSNYYDKNAIDTALSSKADTSAVTAEISAAVSGKQDTSAMTAYTLSSVTNDLNNVVTAHTADSTVHVTSSEKQTWNAKSDFSGSYDDLTDKPTIPTVPTSNTAFTNDAGYITSSDAQTQIDNSISGKADTSAVTEEISAAVSGKQDTSAMTAYTLSSVTNDLNTVVTSHTADSTVHVTSSEKQTWNAKSDFSGSYDDLTDKPTIPTVPTSNTAFTNDAGYITSGDAQTQINNSITGKANSSDVYTTGQTSSSTQISDALSAKQGTLSAGTGIDITNDVISVTGGGGGTIDSSLDDTSPNAVANSAITNGINAVSESLSGYVTTNTNQNITGQKTFVGTKMVYFDQSTTTDKLGFTLHDNYGGEFGAFELNPTGITINYVRRPLMTLNHYRGNGGRDIQTTIGIRQYDSVSKGAYNLLAPLPENAKTPFSLTTSIKDLWIPMGFKNGSTMLIAETSGVVDFTSILGGLKLLKLTQAEYDALSPDYDSSTLYIITQS